MCAAVANPSPATTGATGTTTTTTAVTTSAGGSGIRNNSSIANLVSLDSRLNNTREVGGQATWSLSSCKPGFGVEQLRDDSHETYWQSDGQLPHLVNICFKRKTTVSAVAVYTDFRLDESYTPSKISVRCGTNFNDLQVHFL